MESRSAKMKNCSLCWTIFIFLALFSHNQASKLMDSLSCFVRFIPSNSTIQCSWSENLVSRELVNISLVDFSGRYSCRKIEETTRSQTHVNRRCSIPFHKNTVWAENVYFKVQPDRSLESGLNTSDKADEAKPQNLQCDVDGNLINCHWKIRMAVAETFDFKLFYDDTTGKKAVCQPSCQEVVPYISCNCSITAKDHLSTSAVLNTIQVGPQTLKTKDNLFMICENIMLPPRTPTIDEKKKGEIFTVDFKKQEEREDPHLYFKDHYRYEICYWTHNGQKSNEVSNDCPGQQKNLSKHDEKTVNFELENLLQANTKYALKVRVRLLGDKCFNGPWSEWSEVKIMQTKAVLNILSLSIMVPVCVILLAIFGLCGYRALLRYRNQWENRIPNPSKSSIIKGFHKTKNIFSLPVGEHLYVEPYNKILYTSSISNDSERKHDSESGSTPDHAQTVSGETFYFPNPFENDYPTTTIVDGYRPFDELTDEPEQTDSGQSQFTLSAFNGPYLFSENT